MSEPPQDRCQGCEDAPVGMAVVHDVGCALDPSCRCYEAPADDLLYLNLKGALERLSRAQTHAPAHWRSDLQAAIDHVKSAGSALCPDQWSRFDQPEYREPKLVSREDGHYG